MRMEIDLSPLLAFGLARGAGADEVKSNDVSIMHAAGLTRASAAYYEVLLGMRPGGLLAGGASAVGSAPFLVVRGLVADPEEALAYPKRFSSDPASEACLYSVAAIELARRRMAKDMEKAVRGAERAADRSGLDWLPEFVSTLCSKALALLGREREASNLLERVENPFYRTVGTFETASILARAGLTKAAVDLIESSLDLMDKIGDRDSWEMAAAEFARVYSELVDPREALRESPEGRVRKAAAAYLASVGFEGLLEEVEGFGPDEKAFAIAAASYHGLLGWREALRRLEGLEEGAKVYRCVAAIGTEWAEGECRRLLREGGLEEGEEKTVRAVLARTLASRGRLEEALEVSDDPLVAAEALEEAVSSGLLAEALEMTMKMEEPSRSLCLGKMALRVLDAGLRLSAEVEPRVVRWGRLSLSLAGELPLRVRVRPSGVDTPEDSELELGPGEGASVRVRFRSPGRAVFTLKISIGSLGVESGVEVEIPPRAAAEELRSIAEEIRSSLRVRGQG